MNREPRRLSLTTTIFLCALSAVWAAMGAWQYASTLMRDHAVMTANSIFALSMMMKRGTGLDAAVAIVETAEDAPQFESKFTTNGGAIEVRDGERYAVIPTPDGARLFLQDHGTDAKLVLEIPLDRLDETQCRDAIWGYGGPLLTGRSHVETEDGHILGIIDSLSTTPKPNALTSAAIFDLCAGTRPHAIRHVVRLR